MEVRQINCLLYSKSVCWTTLKHESECHYQVFFKFALSINDGRFRNQECIEKHRWTWSVPVHHRLPSHLQFTMHPHLDCVLPWLRWIHLHLTLNYMSLQRSPHILGVCVSLLDALTRSHPLLHLLRNLLTAGKSRNCNSHGNTVGLYQCNSW